MTPARRRVSFGNGLVMMLAYRMMFGRFLLPTRMHSSTEHDQPSALVPETSNVLLNLGHQQAGQVAVVQVSEHVIDPRLLT
jgi:hypothetical protein